VTDLIGAASLRPDAPTLFANDEFQLHLLPRADTFDVVAAGLARALGFRDAYRLTESIPENEKGYTLSCTPGGDQRVLVLTEPGFYRAIGQRQAARIVEQRDTARAELETAKPKAAAFDTYIGADDTDVVVRTAAKMLQFAGERALRKWLLDHGYLFWSRTHQTVYITPKGVEAIRRRVAKDEQQAGEVS
jgi:phage antirepressor YoqD-like protein